MRRTRRALTVSKFLFAAPDHTMAVPFPRSGAAHAPASASPGAHPLPWTPLLLITGAAFVLRLLRLSWQPLWWDEGYSIYFATEPFVRMLDLTARDIHPPLYYALLQGWIALFGAGPVAARTLSALLGALALPALAWLATLHFPGRRGLLWAAVLLLAISPAHLYYSQEVRMYSLALLLSILATGAFWRLVRRLESAPQRVPGAAAPWAAAPWAAAWLWAAAWPWAAVAWYALAATLALHTLYYTALLLLAHAIWALVVLRRRVWPALIAAWAATLALTLPWLFYAVPRLVGYVAQKVEADQDRPLGPLAYLARHATLFLVGHVETLTAYARLRELALWSAGAAALLLLVAAALRARARGDGSPDPVRALFAFLLLPAAAAFLLNLRLPFFPTGGERLLLMLLPFWLLLLAAGAGMLARFSRALAGAALALIALAAAVGVGLFFTTPRYTAEDYRPLLRHVVQQAAPGDTLVALFPWLVGYWRAYTPPELPGATPLLVSNEAVEFGPQIQQALSAAQERGTLWFPEPLALGSSLPQQIEGWLGTTARNVENRWFSPAIRLTAWAVRDAGDLPAPSPSGADFGSARLQAAAAAGTAVAGGAPLPVTLVWEPGAAADLVATLRLLDAEGRVWAARDIPFPAAAAGEPDDAASDSSSAQGAPPTDEVALLVPVGTPPGTYHLFVGVGQATDEREQSQLLPLRNAAEGTLLAPLGAVQVALPADAPALARLPGTPLRPIRGRPLQIAAVTLPAGAIVAGAAFNADLFAHSLVSDPPAAELAIMLQQRRGDATATWRSGPLGAFPTASWPQAYPVRIPASFYVAADLPSGRYDVVANWVDPANGASLGAVELGSVLIAQRSRSYVQPAGGVELAPTPTLGTHARLHSYTLARDGNTLRLGLTWEVLQPLLPPHHIFVHADVDAADGSGTRTIAQADGPPLTPDGAAPTGSWLAGEYLTTLHTLTLPAAQQGAQSNEGAITVRVGLYEPQSLVRLPVSLDGRPAGDSVDLITLAAR